jgi:hypothetical protein
MAAKRTWRAASSARRVSLVALLGVLVLLATAAYGVFAAASKPDFTLSAAPSTQTVSPGGKTSYTVSISRLNGFTGSVSLSLSKLPTGATASFSPNPIGSTQSSSVLTVITSSSTPTGTYTLTVTGTSGNLSHSSSVTLVVQKGQTPDFTVSVSPTSQQLLQGDQTTYTVSVASVAGFTSAVTLSVSGLPNGVTGSFAPNPVAPTPTPGTKSTLSNASTGNFTLTITGTSGSLVHSQQVALAVLQTMAFSIRGDANTSKLFIGLRTPVDPFISNPYSNFGLSISSIIVTLGSVTAPGACSLQDFRIEQLDPTAYPVVVPAGAQNATLSSLIQAGHPSWSANQVRLALPQLTLLNRTINQDGCKNATISFSYSGSAGKA